MAAVDLVSSGPPQRGRGVHGQYVYLIVFSHPHEETVRRLQLRTPADFTRESFRALSVESHAAAGVEVVETAAFAERHTNGEVHLNLLVRASTQYRWKAVAEQFRSRAVHVDFAAHIKTWAEGVMYLQVASDHKPAEEIDHEYKQWARTGQPTPLQEFLPSRFLSPGFRRKTRMSSLAFADVCIRHSIDSVDDLWVKAAELSRGGDRGLLSYLMDNNAEAQLNKVLKGKCAEERARRGQLTREALLEEHYNKHACCCSPQGRCYELMKDLLIKNGLDGRLQGVVLGALRAGRAKKRTICLLGGTDCGQSFLFRGFSEIFHVYERPDSGSYQLEDLEGKELVFLNDFTYDDAARAWMSWPYLKNFLDGGDIPIGKSKSGGGRNTVFKGTAPVLMTAPEEVKLMKRGVEVHTETVQMQKRVVYVHLTYSIPEEERQEVLRHCGHCTARLYLEGRPQLAPTPAPVRRLTSKTTLVLPPPNPAARGSVETPGQSSQGSRGSSEAGTTKRPRTVSSCIAELKDLKALLDAGVLLPAEFERLKLKLLAES